jgi:hypothetical protein
MSNKIFCAKAIEVVLHATKHGWKWADTDFSHMTNAARPGDKLVIAGDGTFHVTKAATKKETPMKNTNIIKKTKSLFANIVFGGAPQPVEKVADNRSREYDMPDIVEGVDRNDRGMRDREYEASNAEMNRAVRQRLGDLSVLPTPPDATRMKRAPLSDNWLKQGEPYVGGETRSGGDYVSGPKSPKPSDVEYPDANKRGAENFQEPNEDDPIPGPANVNFEMRRVRPGNIGGHPVAKAKDSIKPGLFTDAVYGERGRQQYRDEEDS